LIVVLVVVAIPEGLPLTIGISLAFSVKQMYQNKILVRKLDAPEKLGQIDDLLCSKTGSVTTAQMKVAEFYCESKPIKNTRKNTFLHCDLNPNTLDKIKSGILYNCDARVEMDAVNYVPIGNQTEVGLMKFLQDADIPVHILIQRKIDRILAHIPFSSDKKFSAVALHHPDKPSIVVIHIKGAPEIIVELCKKMSAGTKDPELQKDERETINHQIDSMALSGLRVIAFASVEMENDTWMNILQQGGHQNGNSPSKILEDEVYNRSLDFSFIAAFGLRDPLRQNVKSQVKFFRDECKITVRMVSGDHRSTAEAIAIKAGILRKDEQRKPMAVLHGEEFRKMVGSEPRKIISKEDGTVSYELEKSDQIEEIARHLRVLARATAKDKYLLTLGLKNLAKKVAVTAEGINDCMALQAADVGITFGTGCSAAKESADIILTDNDFGASLHAIMWGRNIYLNISRFLQCQVTVNISCLATVAFGSIIFGQSPLTSV
jgi:Ca2+-transporting ATPase